RLDDSEAAVMSERLVEHVHAPFARSADGHAPPLMAYLVPEEPRLCTPRVEEVTAHQHVPVERRSREPGLRIAGYLGHRELLERERPELLFQDRDRATGDLGKIVGKVPVPQEVEGHRDLALFPSRLVDLVRRGGEGEWSRPAHSEFDGSPST